MKRPRLEPFEILTANKRSNPLVTPRAEEVEAARVKTAAAASPEPVPPKPSPTQRVDRPKEQAEVPPTGTATGRSRVVLRTLSVVRVTPLLLGALLFGFCLAAGLAFVGGYRAGSAEIEASFEKAAPGSFDEIRRERVVRFENLEVDRGPLRR
jgi:hypothetical protein